MQKPPDEHIDAGGMGDGAHTVGLERVALQPPRIKALGHTLR